MKQTKIIVRTALIAALYFVLTVALAPISYGPFQFRLSEAIVLLPLIFPAEGIIGLTLGCLLANIFSPTGWYDMVFGTLSTLIACLSSVGIRWLFYRKNQKNNVFLPFLGGIPHIITNMTILPIMWYLLGLEQVVFINMGLICLTEAATIYAIGVPLYFALLKLPFIKKEQDK